MTLSHQLRKAYQRKHILKSSAIRSMGMIAGVEQVARKDCRNNFFSRMQRRKYQTTISHSQRETRTRPMKWLEKQWVRKKRQRPTKTSPTYSRSAGKATRQWVFSACIIPTRSHWMFELRAPRWLILTSSIKTICCHSSSLGSSKSSKTISRLATIRYL